MRNIQPFPYPSGQFTDNIKRIKQKGRALGFLEAMAVVGMLPAATRHPLEVKVLDQAYMELERNYAKQFKTARADDATLNLFPTRQRRA